MIPVEQPKINSKPNNLVQSIEKVALILDRVGKNLQGVSIRDLSVDLKIPKGTIHRILTSLSYVGYIRQHPETKNYFLGFKLMELAALLGNQLDLRKVAEPVLRDLANRTKLAANLVILDRNEIVFIDKVETQQPVGTLKMASRVGSRNPVHSCAVGKVLLCHMPEEEVDRILSEAGLPRRTPTTITSASRFKAHLKVVHSQGYGIDDEENEQGIRCLAAPVFDGRGNAVAAVSVAGPAFLVTPEALQGTIRKEVMAAAAEVSRRLGFQKG
jgi:DNA-binding IclR family transcriptional regulator